MPILQAPMGDLLWRGPLAYEGGYSDRMGRYYFAVANFGTALRGKVLDVGCDEGYLKDILSPQDEYTGVDLYGKPTIRLDLEKGALPFEDSAFDCVCGFDVLEHLDNTYAVFDEMMRVSGRYVLVSLPNNYYFTSRLHMTFLGRNLSAKYGLPPEPPRDRHRWLFNFREAVDFVHARGQRNHFKIVREFPLYLTRGKLGFVRKVAKRFGLLPNFLGFAYWGLLERQNPKRVSHR